MDNEYEKQDKDTCSRDEVFFLVFGMTMFNRVRNKKNYQRSTSTKENQRRTTKTLASKWRKQIIEVGEGRKGEQKIQKARPREGSSLIPIRQSAMYWRKRKQINRYGRRDAQGIGNRGASSARDKIKPPHSLGKTTGMIKKEMRNCDNYKFFLKKNNYYIFPAKEKQIFQQEAVSLKKKHVYSTYNERFALYGIIISSI